jgi:hypothetical protein
MSASSSRVFRILVLLTSGFTAGVGAYHLLGEAVDMRMGSMKERYEAQLDAAERQNKVFASQISSLQAQVKRCAVSVDSDSSSPPVGTELTPQDTPSRPGDAERLARDLPVFEAKASSAKYEPMNVLDGNVSLSTYTSRWISADRETEGAWLELHLPEAATVTAVKIYMAVQKRSAGGQIRDAELIFPGSPSQAVRFPFKFGWQQVDIQPVHTDLVRLVVRSVYPGQQENFGVDVFEAGLVGY